MKPVQPIAGVESVEVARFVVDRFNARGFQQIGDLINARFDQLSMLEFAYLHLDIYYMNEWIPIIRAPIIQLLYLSSKVCYGNRKY